MILATHTPFNRSQNARCLFSYSFPCFLIHFLPKNQNCRTTDTQSAVLYCQISLVPTLQYFTVKVTPLVWIELSKLVIMLTALLQYTARSIRKVEDNAPQCTKRKHDLVRYWKSNRRNCHEIGISYEGITSITLIPLPNWKLSALPLERLTRTTRYSFLNDLKYRHLNHHALPHWFGSRDSGHPDNLNAPAATKWNRVAGEKGRHD